MLKSGPCGRIPVPLLYASCEGPACASLSLYAGLSGLTGSTSCQLCAGTWSKRTRRWPTDLARQQAMEVWGAPEAEQAPETPGPASARRESARSLEESADRKSKWQKPGFKGQSGGGGKGSYHGSWRDPNDPWSYDSTPLGEAEKELLRNMAKMLMRHESEMRLLRQDTTWMFFVDTAETGILSLIQQKPRASKSI